MNMPTSQNFDEIELVAEKTGELNDRVGKIEHELGTQTKTLESAALVLDAAIKGLGALKSSVLENDLAALQLSLNEKTAHLEREIGRFEMAVTEIDRRAESGDETIKAALLAAAQSLRTQFDTHASDVSKWSQKVEQTIAEHSVALAAIPAVIKGADAKTFNPRGEWAAGMVTNLLDVVSYAGSSYVSNEDGNTDKPAKSKRYTVLAKRAGGLAISGGGDSLFNLTGEASNVGNAVTLSNSAVIGKVLTGLTVAAGTVAATDTVLQAIGELAGNDAALANPRAPAQALVFDGTNYAAGSILPATVGDFSVNLPFIVPNLVVQGYVVSPTPAASGFSIVITTAGKVLIVNATVATVLTSVGTLVANTAYNITYSRSGTSGSLYINGVLDSTVTDNQTYANACIRVGAAGDGGQIYGGVLGRINSFNRALSAAEVLALYQQAAPAAADYPVGIAGLKNTVAFVNNGFETFSGATATGFTAAETGPYGEATTRPLFAVRVGDRVIVKYTATISTGTFSVALIDPGVATRSNLVTGVANGTEQTITLTCSAAATVGVGFYSSACTGLVVSAVNGQLLGLLAAPDAQQPGAGLQWLDASGNRAHLLLPASGVTWRLPNVSGQIIVEATVVQTAASNIQLGGASIIDTLRGWRILSISANSTAITTINLGNVSAGAQHVSAAVLAVGNNALTIVGGFTTTANLWSNSSAIATIRYTLTLAPA